MKKTLNISLAAISALALAGCATTGMGSLTGGESETSAAAGQASADSKITRCTQTLGTLAVSEEEDSYWHRAYVESTGLNSIEPIIRQMVQESNCFVIVAGADTKQQRTIDRMMEYSRDSGEVRAGSNVETGQAINADYVLFPEVLYSGEDEGGTDIAGAAITGLGGLIGGNIGAVAGRMSTDKKSSQVNLSVWSVRSRAQLASSTANKTTRDFKVGGLGIGGLQGGAFQTASRTPEGKATVAAFVDSYNAMVVALQNYEAQTVEGGAGTGGLIGDVQ